MRRAIATALVGAAVVAAPAVAQEADPSDEITLVKMPQSSGDWPPYWPNTVERPEFIDVVQAQGRFFALAGGQGDAACASGGTTVCFIQYDWTEGVWTARDITQPPRPGGYDLHAIATDGGDLVVSLSDGMNVDRLYRSADLGQTWTASSVTAANGYGPSADKFAARPLISGGGFMAIGAGADYTDPNKAIVSTDGGATFGPSASLAANQGLTDAASDTVGGIAWATSGTGPAGVKSSVQWTSGFLGSTTDAADIAGPSWVANLGPATFVVAKDNRSSYYRPAPGQAVVPGPYGGQNVTDLIAAPDVTDKAVIEISGNGYVHLRDSQRRWPSLTYMTGVKRGAVYGNLVMLVGTNGTWGYIYNTAKWPEFGFDFDPDKITGNELPGVPDPPLIPPPDVPAVIDGEHSVIMPELGVTPKDEDGKPVTAPATATAPAARWNPDADGYCEWRGKKVACVSQMNPLPEATGLYTLKANLSGTSVSSKGACRWTTTKPQCRVWLQRKGRWRLTWSGENAGKVVTGARTVVVK